MHPADEIRGVKSKRLFKKKIVLGITGSIAAVESVEVAQLVIEKQGQQAQCDDPRRKGHALAKAARTLFSGISHVPIVNQPAVNCRLEH